MKALKRFLFITLALGLVACSKNEAPVDTPKHVAPTITTQPSDANVIVGHNAIFAVAATGTEPLSYQWKKNGANVPGATGTTYVFPSVQSDSGATISCAVTNAAGSAMSRTAVLTLVTLPVILSQPVSQTIEAGLPVTFTVSATGTELSYQWKKNGVSIPGATGSSVTMDTVVQADSGAALSAVISNPAGSVTSSSAVLTVQTVIAIGRPLLGGTICYVDSTGQHGLIVKRFAHPKNWYENHALADSVGGFVPSLARLSTILFPNKQILGLRDVFYWASEEAPEDPRIGLSILFNSSNNPQFNGQVVRWLKTAYAYPLILFSF